MKVLYDHQTFTMQKWGGISRYFSELMRELSASDDVEIVTSTRFSNNEYLLDLDDYGVDSFLPGISFRGKVQLLGFFNRIYTKRVLKKGEFDIFHPTYYDPYLMKGMERKPLVITVYDLIQERLPSHFPKNDHISDKKRRIVERADKVIAISEQTRDDLIKIFGVDEKKISVIYLANSLDHNVEDIQSGVQNLPEKYILYVGVRKGYKNFQTFAEAITPILQQDEDWHLLCVGGRAFDASEKKWLKKNSIYNKSIQISCNDNELKHIYSRAGCYVFPSLYEGFGLPVLEAFSANCPVVCSNRGSLPEIASDAAIYFDPQSEVEIRESVKKTIYDETLRKKLIEKGKRRSKQFSWQETARQTKEIYESLV